MPVLSRSTRVRRACMPIRPTCLLLCAALMLLLSGGRSTMAEIAFTPDWQAPGAGYPTGVGWADLDGNGWADLIVTNGLDFGFAANQAFYNVDGRLAPVAGWTSTDTLCSGNLALGDLDGDGDPELVCANMGHIPSGSDPQPHAIYWNHGTLATTPAWHSPPANAFSCALGDPDNDGDLDVAFGQGLSAVDSAGSRYWPVVIYANDQGRIGREPSWASDDRYITTDLAFADLDRDGRQDLVIGGRDFGLAVFYNRDGRLETSPSWVHPGGLAGARQLACGDVDGDGDEDLAFCAVDAYGRGGGRFVVLENRDGRLDPDPYWSCDRYIEPAAVAWADADGDGDLDLAGGGWNMHAGVFENHAGRLGAAYAWSHVPGWVQQVAWCDYDRSAITTVLRRFTGDGTRSLFVLGEKALPKITRVAVDGRTLAHRDYCCDPTAGWVSLASTPAAGSVIEIHYERSRNPDLAVTTLAKIRTYKNAPPPMPEEARVLVILPAEVGGNFNFDYRHGLLGPVRHSIHNQMRDLGWELTLTAMQTVVDSCHESGAQLGARSVRVDRLLTEIESFQAYDAVTIMPGRGYERLLGDRAVLARLARAERRGVVVSAWCRGVQVLAAAGVVQGRRVTGHDDYADLYAQAGAHYLGPDTPPVIDGNIVTGVRSRYYRTEMLEAIGAAVHARRSR